MGNQASSVNTHIYCFQEVKEMIENNDINKLSEIIKNRQIVDINIVSDLHPHKSLLTIACEYGHIDCVRTLLSYGAELNNRLTSEKLLSAAIHSGSAELVSFLISRGVEIDDSTVKAFFDDPFLLHHSDITMILLEHVNNITVVAQGSPTLIDATYYSVEQHHILLRNRGFNHYSLDYWQDNALALASKLGHTDVVEALLVWNNNSHIPKSELYLALGHACENGNLTIIRALLEYITDPDAYSLALLDTLGSDHGSSSDSKRMETAEYLLTHGADANYRTATGKTILSLLCHSPYICNIDMMRLLLKHGADVNAPDAQGLVPLYKARHNYDAIQLLLQYGANPDERFKYYRTILLDAVSVCPRIVTLLLNHGANPNLAHRKSGTTALMIAALQADIGLVSTLLSYGADVLQMDYNGQTVFDLIASAENAATTTTTGTEADNAAYGTETEGTTEGGGGLGDGAGNRVNGVGKDKYEDVREMCLRCLERPILK